MGISGVLGIFVFCLGGDYAGEPEISHVKEGDMVFTLWLYPHNRIRFLNYQGLTSKERPTLGFHTTRAI
ncbi:hypothetical protein TNCT_587471, partial [Trichonephila clavata]